MENKHYYKVIKRIQENDNVVTLGLTCDNNSMPKFVSGQYITLYYPQSGIQEGKAYSISSAPHEKFFTVTVKDVGVFSHMLCSCVIGDTLEGSLPYGYFYSEEETTPLIMFASGIGVTPLFGMIKHVLYIHKGRRVHLEYSVKRTEDVIFIDTFLKLTKKHPLFTFVVSITREPRHHSWERDGRISVVSVVTAQDPDRKAEYFVCGSISFVRDIWRELRSLCVHEEQIYTEAFFGNV